MELRPDSNVIIMPRSDEWSVLIRKLRWIGLDNEADRLQAAIRALPPVQQDAESTGSRSND